MHQQPISDPHPRVHSTAQRRSMRYSSPSARPQRSPRRAPHGPLIIRSPSFLSHAAIPIVVFLALLPYAFAQVDEWHVLLEEGGMPVGRGALEVYRCCRVSHRHSDSPLFLHSVGCGGLKEVGPNPCTRGRRRALCVPLDLEHQKPSAVVHTGGRRFHTRSSPCFARARLRALTQPRAPLGHYHCNPRLLSPESGFNGAALRGHSGELQHPELPLPFVHTRRVHPAGPSRFSPASTSAACHALISKTNTATGSRHAVRARRPLRGEAQACEVEAAAVRAHEGGRAVRGISSPRRGLRQE
ncbi:hypothetical protein MSAN_00097900 [Mycena sanguinolenta]|uniref:Uncharacterized protein n=1 Tax=Mycena sanguinolenta TaxID=230812 RepID=A0A8H6ZJT2_9AGAR|nr:hypothetical protein MSAN_00097900 [Mycena sanguinolenta]